MKLITNRSERNNIIRENILMGQNVLSEMMEADRKLIVDLWRLHLLKSSKTYKIFFTFCCITTTI